jgi:SNF2 family DNA or RNA helicase
MPTDRATKWGKVINQHSWGERLLLTATPLQNSLLELYGLSSIIDDFIFGDLTSFRDQ